VNAALADKPGGFHILPGLLRIHREEFISSPNLMGTPREGFISSPNLMGTPREGFTPSPISWGKPREGFTPSRTLPWDIYEKMNERVADGTVALFAGLGRPAGLPRRIAR